MNQIRIAYDSRQSAKKNNSFSPSAGKPALAVKSWQKLGIDLHFIKVEKAMTDQIKAVHSSKYVDDILSCRIQNGFSNKFEEVADSLPWVCGSVISAAESAITDNGIVFSPTSGAHHAGYDFSGGFCTFNSLVVGAHYAWDMHGLDVGIVDCDCHYGNGTDDIIKKLKLDYITHLSMGKGGAKHKDYLRQLAKGLEKFKNVEVVFYNAGADPHENDPLGGKLSTWELAVRDRMVIGFFRSLNIPMVICLAGGYQDPIENVLQIHDNTMRIANRINNTPLATLAAAKFLDGHAKKGELDYVDLYSPGASDPDEFHNDQLIFADDLDDLNDLEFSEDDPRPGDFLNELDELLERFDNLDKETLRELVGVWLRYNMDR